MLGLWQHRRFIWDAALSDLRYRYAGSSLGAFWNIITPLALLALYTFVFSNVFVSRLNVGTGLFVLYLASGFLPWGAFAECVASSTQALMSNSAYLKKMPIPEQVFVAKSAISSMLSMLIVVGLLVCAALFLGQPPQLTWLLMPVLAVLWQVLGFGLGLTLATFNVFFRDVAQVLTVLFQIWMWSLPVVYAEELLPAAYRGLLMYNPAYPFLRALREVYLSAQVPELDLWGGMLGWSVVTVVAGFVVLGALRSEIRDVL